MNYGPFARKLRQLGPRELMYTSEIFRRGRMSIFFNEGGIVDGCEWLKPRRIPHQATRTAEKLRKAIAIMERG